MHYLKKKWSVGPEKPQPKHTTSFQNIKVSNYKQILNSRETITEFELQS